jgi:hypothetical protein
MEAPSPIDMLNCGCHLTHNFTDFVFSERVSDLVVVITLQTLITEVLKDQENPCLIEEYRPTPCHIPMAIILEKPGLVVQSCLKFIGEIVVFWVKSQLECDSDNYIFFAVELSVVLGLLRHASLLARIDIYLNEGSIVTFENFAIFLHDSILIGYQFFPRLFHHRFI